MQTNQPRQRIVGSRANRAPRRRLRVRADAIRDRARRVLGVDTDYAIAQKLNLHPSSVSLIFNGRKQPGERFIAAVLAVLRCSFEDVIEVVEDEEPEPALAGVA